MGVTAVMGTRQSVVVGIAAAAIGVLVGQPLAGAAATLPQRAAGPAVPQVTVPSVTLPSVSTPVGTTPAVTTPSITTPSVSVPTVTTPPVSTPVGTIPSVTTPSVSVPVATAPTATAPPAPAPARTTASKVSVLAGGTTRSAQSSGATRDPASAVPGAPAGGPGTASGTGTIPSAAGSGSSQAAGARPALVRGRSGVARPGSPRARRLAAARETRRLRRLVARLRGCLAGLDDGARRLLTLRAGLHGPARSAAATARILRVSARREARLERLALAGLEHSATTGCSGTVTPAITLQAPAGQTGAPLSESPAPGASASGPSASLSAAHAERSGGGVRRASVRVPPVHGVERAGTGSSFPSVLIPALVALLFAAGLISLPEVRRRLGPATAGVGTGAAASAGTTAAAPTARAVGPAAPGRSSRGRSAPHPAVRPKRSQPAMDEALAAMAADVFAEMTRDAPTTVAHPQPEADGMNHHPQVELDRMPRYDPRPHPAPWHTRSWAYQHATQAALLATLLVSGVARLLRRARRGHRGSR